MPKVLIVDDEEDQEEIIMQRFAHKSYMKEYQFLFARNGLEGLRMAQEHKDIELVLLDINMPKMDGLSLLREIKNINPETQAIILSAYGDMSNIRSAMNKGAFDFLTKPIDLVDLDLTLQKTIAHLSKVRENLRIQQENRSLIEKSLQLEMQALRAQMNPHFIFNSLNSINNFILKNDKEDASEYLLKFSRLTRMILENSKNTLIGLDQELEALKLYIQLESVRFVDHFEYDITHAEDLDTASLFVPPLILQPYVENAIHHGLLQKAGPGTLHIHIQEKEGDLIIKIEDDGIGRTLASEISAKNPFKRSPMGINVTRERLTLLQRPTDRKSDVLINDLIDSNGQPIGTEVLITIPVML